MGKIRYAPLSIPLSRRLQTLSVLVYCVLIPLGILLFFSSLAWPALRPFTLLYLLWMIYDQAPFRGSRRSDWMRHSFVWKHFVAYYPIKLIKASLHSACAALLRRFVPRNHQEESHSVCVFFRAPQIKHRSNERYRTVLRGVMEEELA